MTKLSKAAFLARYNDASTGLYKPGQIEGIGSDDHRQQISDIKDSALWPEDLFVCRAKTAATLPAYHILSEADRISFGLPDGFYLQGNVSGALVVDSYSFDISADVNSYLLVDTEGSEINGVYKVINAGNFENQYIIVLITDDIVGLFSRVLYVQNGSTFESTTWSITPPQATPAAAGNNGPWKQDRVRLKTAAALPACTYSTVGGIPTLIGDDAGALEIDGVEVDFNDSVLISEESTSFHNGVYIVSNTGGTILGNWQLTLRSDSRTADQIALAIYQVREGDTNSDTLWKQTFDETGSAISNVAYELFETGGGGTSDEAETEWITIPSADVLTANTDPVDLVTDINFPTYCLPIQVTAVLEWGTTAYATNTQFAIRYSGGLELLYDPTNFLAHDGATNFKVIRMDIPIVDAQFSETIQFFVVGGNPTDGDSDIKIKIKYKTVNVTTI